MGWWIVEGVDGAGKTSLVERIRATLQRIDSRPVIVKHHSQLRQDPFLEYELEYVGCRPGSSAHFISDRWALGERVWGPLYRGGSALSDVGWVHVDKFAESRGAFPILMTNTPEELRRRFARRGEDYLRDEHLERVIADFASAALDSLLPWQVMIDPNEDEVEWVVEYGLKWEQLVTPLTAYPTYVGPLLPRYLLLGERRNDPRFPSAFVPYPSTSGAYLINALRNHPHVIEDCGVANALEEPVKVLWETLGRPNVVALGKKSEAVCREALIPFVPVPHPQFIRRFHHKRHDEYGSVIAVAAEGKQVEFA